MSSDDDVEYRLEIPRCPCGREGRYFHESDGKRVISCNKYAVCPTYEELDKNAGELFKDLLTALRAADDLMIYKDSSKYYKDAERIIEEIKKRQQVK